MKQTIKLAINPKCKDTHTDTVEAKQVLGSLAITQNINSSVGDKRKWVITHIPTGHIFARPNSLKQARIMLKSLAEAPHAEAIANVTIENASEFAAKYRYVLDYCRGYHTEAWTLADFLAAQESESKAA